jgi:N-acetylmuramoyl-L-alanine amidase
VIKNVVLDFGHGGIDEDGNYTTAPKKMHTYDDGTVAHEGVLNRQIGEQIYNCLKEHPNLNVVLTVGVDESTDLSLKKRVEIANELDPKSTIFVSVHCNASPSHNAGGFEIFTSVGETESDKLAGEVRAMARLAVHRAGMRDRGLKESNFFVLRNTNCTAILIECGFFDFKPDFVKLKDPRFQGDLGSMIYTGIINYINGKN